MTHSNHSRYKGQYGKAVNQQHVAKLAVGGVGASGGAVFAVVKLAVGDSFVPQHVPQMPDPALLLANNGHRAFRLEHGPQFHDTPGDDKGSAEEGDHKDGVDGVVAVEHLTENNAAIGSAGEPLAAVKAGANPPHKEPQHCGDGEQHGQARGLAHKFANAGGFGQFAVNDVACRAHKVGRLCAARAKIRAVAAVVAKPQVNVGAQLVFEAPGSPDHFLARIRRIGRGEGAGHGAGGALVALLEGFAPRFFQCPDKLHIRFD